MKVLYLPSWWPTTQNPFSGIFFKEQIERLAKLNPEHRFTVLYWGHPNFELKPGKILKVLKDFFFSRNEPINPIYQPNLIFINYSFFTLPRKFFGINFQIYFLKRFIKRHLKEDQFDLIHAMVGQPSGVIANNLSKSLKIPYVLTEVMAPFPFPHLRNSDGTIWEPLRKAYLNASVNIADGGEKVIAMNKEGFSKVVHIPNFVNEDKFNIGSAKRYSSESPFVFFTLGGFVKRKGLDVLLKAISLLKNKEQYRFVIAGSGPEEHALRKMTTELKLDEIVEWQIHTSREQAVEQYQRSHAFVLPSRAESFGIVYIESLLCGKPIIATRCGGPQDFVNETTGVLCEIDNVEELSKAIEDMKNSIQKYDSDKIRDWALERYSSKVVCSQIIECYKNSIN